MVSLLQSRSPQVATLVPSGDGLGEDIGEKEGFDEGFIDASDNDDGS